MVSKRLDVKKEWRKAFRESLAAARPICLGYVAIGFPHLQNLSGNRLSRFAYGLTDMKTLP